MDLMDAFNLSPAPHAGPAELALALLLSGVLTWLLGRFFIRFGHAFSDRRAFAPNLVIMGMTTAMVITVVKGSLALSLGLVGALSIVRFRTAVKEAEELLYLFIAIAVGLGAGAGAVTLTLTAFAILLGALWLQRRPQTGRERGWYVVISTKPKGLAAGRATELLQAHATQAALRRVEDGPQGRELTLLASFPDDAAAERALQSLRRADPGAAVSLLEQRAELG